MADRSRRKRAGRARLLGRRRASSLADRLGTALKTSRVAAGLTQQNVGDEAGVTQGWVSEAERGLGASGSLETWASLAAATGMQLAAFLEMAPGASPPRDMQHLKRQQAVIARTVEGGWVATPEFALRTGDGVHRFVDVHLDRSASREVVVVEIVDLFADVGDDLRGLERKVEAVRALMPGRRVAGLLIVRSTRRNRALVRTLGMLLAARFSSGRGWLRALDGVAPLPDGDGILWSGSASPELSALRLPRPPAPPRSRRSRPPGRAGSGT